MKTLKNLNILLLCSIIVLAFGCEDDDIDYRPPAGHSAIGIDNNTSSDIDVYIDGVRRITVGDWSEQWFDLEPGIYRLVLNDQDDDRSYATDVDLLADNLTEVTVTTSSTDYGEFDVRIVFRD